MFPEESLMRSLLMLILVVAGEPFDEANIQILATLHLGWRF